MTRIALCPKSAVRGEVSHPARSYGSSWRTAATTKQGVSGTAVAALQTSALGEAATTLPSPTKRNPAARPPRPSLLCLRQAHLGRDADFPAARGKRQLVGDRFYVSAAAEGTAAMATKRMFATTHVLTRGLSSARLVFDRFRNASRETFSMAHNGR